MTSDIRDLINSSFYMMYYLNIPPSEVDNLSTYEMREYVSLLNERRKVENESDSSMFKSLASIFGMRKKSKS